MKHLTCVGGRLHSLSLEQHGVPVIMTLPPKTIERAILQLLLIISEPKQADSAGLGDHQDMEEVCNPISVHVYVAPPGDPENFVTMALLHPAPKRGDS